jgi:hypothetical protein
MNPIDIVYVLGSGSQWHNNEIRFSLRAIAKNLTGYGRIWIIGEDPGCLKEVTHIYYPDELGVSNADGNIIRKVLRACSEPDLSDDFLFINDDHLINKPIEISAIPAFHKGDMTKYPDNYWQTSFWRNRLERTRDELIRQNLPCNHYDCHTPILFNKDRFPEIMSRFDYATGIGYTMKSLYGNVACTDGPRLGQEKKTVFKIFTLNELNDRLNSCGFVSYNDDGLNSALKVWLIRNYPDPSPWEIGHMIDPIIEIHDYLQGEQDFPTGALLFEKYCQGANMKKLFSHGETPQLRRKLIYKLKSKLNML